MPVGQRPCLGTARTPRALLVTFVRIGGTIPTSKQRSSSALFPRGKTQLAWSWNSGVSIATARVATKCVASSRPRETWAASSKCSRARLRLRMQELLPSDLRARIAEFTVAQLISLRLAGHAELPVLAQRVLDEKPTSLDWCGKRGQVPAADWSAIPSIWRK